MNKNIQEYWKYEILAMYYYTKGISDKYEKTLTHSVKIWNKQLTEEDMDFLNRLPPVENYTQALVQIKEYSEETYNKLLEIIKNEE